MFVLSPGIRVITFTQEFLECIQMKKFLKIERNQTRLLTAQKKRFKALFTEASLNKKSLQI
jgi:hypothetical protein